MDSSDILLRTLVSATEGQFQPSNEQRRAKSAFWSYFASEEGSYIAPSQDLATASRFGRSNRISQWWDTPGFQDWFYNRDEFRQRMEYLADLAIDELEAIVSARNIQNSDKLNAIKLIMQVTQKTGTTDSKSDSLPTAINNMSREQLEEFIRNSMDLLPPASNQKTQ